jgi:hypothetical protein
MAKERRPIERCRRKGATRWSNITLLELGTKSAPKAKLPLADPRAGIAKSSVHACSGKPVRPKLYGPVAVTSTREASPSHNASRYHEVCTSHPYFVSSPCLRCRSRCKLFVSLHAALYHLELPFHKKTVPGATPVSATSESHPSSASPSGPRTPGASAYGDFLSTTVLRGCQYKSFVIVIFRRVAWAATLSLGEGEYREVGSTYVPPQGKHQTQNHTPVQMRRSSSI